MKKLLVLAMGVVMFYAFESNGAEPVSKTMKPDSGASNSLIKNREELPKKYTWATELIFPNKKEWEKEFNAAKGEIGKLDKFKGSLANGGADNLVKFLKMSDDLEARLDRVYVYASLLSDQDTSVSEHLGMKNKVIGLFVQYGQETAWFTPEMTSIPYSTVKKWMSKDKDLAVYAQFFHNLYRQKEHVLSDKEEKILAMAGDALRTPYSAYNVLTNSDIQFPKMDANGQEVELNDAAFYLLMRDPDRNIREKAYKGLIGTYKGFGNTAAALLNGLVQSHILQQKARGYDSCLQAALDGGNIPVEVYNTLVKTVNDNLPLLHRYQKIRKEVLKLEDGVHAYDLFAPMADGEKMEFTYEEGVELMTKALQPFGPEYLDPMEKGIESRWIDVYPTKGKRSGAYSSGTYLTQPFILLNFHGGYEDVSTLAHEMGHSMHSFFSRGTQPYVYSNYDIFCAEVASTTNEILLQNYMLKNIDNKMQKLQLLGEFLETVRGTVFRQTMFSEFEQKIHEMAEAGQPLTADTLGKTYGEIMKNYYGPAYVHDDVVDNYWIRIPHFYYNFYVYKYSTSYCAATALAKRIESGDPKAIKAYMDFLKAGCSKYPVDLLKDAGVDMTSPKPYQDCMNLFENLLDETESLLKEVDAKK